MNNTLKLYTDAVTRSALLCADYVACTDDAHAANVWELYEASLAVLKRQRAALAALLAEKAGVDVARVIL